MADIGDEMVLQLEVRDRDGELTDPNTVVGWILPPNADSPVTLSFDRVSEGIYEALYINLVSGEHWWRAETSGAVKAAEERSYKVRPQKVPYPVSPPNLFIQKLQPDFNTFTENSLWIPVDVNGVALPVNEWEVFTGLTSEEGGNLFIQEEAPTPTVDSLWIPLWFDGSAKYVDEWKVYTGLGSNPAIGNKNLYIQPIIPSNPIQGSLWIALNNDLTPTDPSNWKVFA